MVVVQKRLGHYWRFNTICKNQKGENSPDDIVMLGFYLLSLSLVFVFRIL